ncbi:MAG: prephenate dehydratase [Acidobacteria bacterium]|nr:prephenate dehydratase [Acidobacteriota bacterium]
MRVFIQGERGSFSHEAAAKLAKGARVVSCATFAGVFDEVAKGAAGVIPIENTLAGSVGENLDLLLERDVFIRAELPLRIAHCLLAPAGVKFADVRRVWSHPVALDQCRKFFRSHPGIEAVPAYDTAGAVRQIVKEGGHDAAAIAGRAAAREYGARILRQNLEDNRQNFTRFLLIGRSRSVTPGANKTSLAFSTKNVAGALFEALGVFAERGISLSRIASRPVRGHPWEYVFFVDFLRGRDAVALDALTKLRKIAGFVKVSGVYQRRD